MKPCNLGTDQTALFPQNISGYFWSIPEITLEKHSKLWTEWSSLLSWCELWSSPKHSGDTLGKQRWLQIGGGVEGMGPGGMGRNTKVCGDPVVVLGSGAKIRPKACEVPEWQVVEHKLPWVWGCALGGLGQVGLGLCWDFQGFPYPWGTPYSS